MTRQIHALYEIALEHKDYTAQVLLQWFITEQLEEEKLTGGILERLKMVEGSRAALLILDAELGSRQGDGRRLTTDGAQRSPATRSAAVLEHHGLALGRAQRRAREGAGPALATSRVHAIACERSPRAGSATVNVVPAPTWLRTAISPCIASTRRGRCRGRDPRRRRCA